jgi:LytS/YehU family sensor histidine kinase
VLPTLVGVETRPRSPRRLFWLLQMGGWLLVVPLSASVAALVFRDSGTIFLFGVLRQGFGFGLSLGLWWFYRRWPAASFKLARHTGQIVVACLLAAVADVLLTAAVHLALTLPPVPAFVERGTVFSRLALYVAWSALYFVIRQELETRGTELRLARAEAANREAELQLLRAQVNPHFLFNALSTIISQAETNPPAVAGTTHAVADYLRYSLTHGSHQAPLGEELTAMAAYLYVERASQGPERLDWSIDASDAARLALVPTALVQPLIENALKYGLRTSPPPLRLRVQARVEPGEIIVAVENTGAWISRASGEKSSDSTGIGLSNLRRRLELLYGPAARLDTTTPAGLVRLEVRLPFVPPAA